MTSEKRIKLLHNLLLKCTESRLKTRTWNPGFSCSYAHDTLAGNSRRKLVLESSAAFRQVCHGH